MANSVEDLEHKRKQRMAWKAYQALPATDRLELLELMNEIARQEVTADADAIASRDRQAIARRDEGLGERGQKGFSLFRGLASLA